MERRSILERDRVAPFGTGGAGGKAGRPKNGKSPGVNTLPPSPAPIATPSLSSFPSPSYEPHSSSRSGSAQPSSTSEPTASPVPTGLHLPSLSPTLLPTFPSQQPAPFSQNGPAFSSSVTPSNSPDMDDSKSSVANSVPSNMPSIEPTGSPENSREPDGSSDNSVQPTFLSPQNFTPSLPPTSVAGSNPSTGSPATTVVVSDTSVVCEGVFVDRREDFWFRYSVEIAPGVLDATIAVDMLEVMILELIEDNLLLCGNPQGIRRRIDEGYGIGGIDYQPQDVLSDEDCPNPQSNCYVYDGLMGLYLVPNSATNVAIFEARSAIRDLMNSSVLNGVAGIERVEYLGPSLDGTSAVKGNGGNGASAEDNSSDPLGSSVIVLLGIACLFFVIALFAGLQYKRHIEKADNDDGPTLATGSQITGINSGLTVDTESPTFRSRNSPQSPFASIIPEMYRVQYRETMSAILENDSDSRNSDIIVSEAEYTEEDSREISFMRALSVDPVLGAHAMEDYDDHDDDGFIFDTRMDFSTPPRVNEEETIEFHPE